MIAVFGCLLAVIISVIVICQAMLQNSGIEQG